MPIWQRISVWFLANEKYSQLVTRLLQYVSINRKGRTDDPTMSFRDIQQTRDMAEHDAKEANNMRLFIHSLHDATYQHRLECVLLCWRSTSQWFCFVGLVEASARSSNAPSINSNWDSSMISSVCNWMAKQSVEWTPGRVWLRMIIQWSAKSSFPTMVS